jgi:hypothetical protein
MPQYPTKPGLRETKHVELWKKYHPLVPEEYQDELCPMPPKAIWMERRIGKAQRVQRREN